MPGADESREAWVWATRLALLQHSPGSGSEGREPRARAGRRRRRPCAARRPPRRARRGPARRQAALRQETSYLGELVVLAGLASGASNSAANRRPSRRARGGLAATSWWRTRAAARRRHVLDRPARESAFHTWSMCAAPPLCTGSAACGRASRWPPRDPGTAAPATAPIKVRDGRGCGRDRGRRSNSSPAGEPVLWVLSQSSRDRRAQPRRHADVARRDCAPGRW